VNDDEPVVSQTEAKAEHRRLSNRAFSKKQATKTRKHEKDEKDEKDEIIG